MTEVFPGATMAEKKGSGRVEKPEGYFSDLFQLFSGKERELELYNKAFAKMERAFPQARVKVGKSQVSFYGKHLFAAFSPPVRRKKDWTEHVLLVTFGLGEPLASHRVAMVVEPYPGRFTHHVLEELDEELFSFLAMAWEFGENKGRGSKAPHGRK